MGQFYEEVKPRDFYRAVFPEGSFEREGHPEDEKCNGVLTVIEGEKARNYIVFDELNMVAVSYTHLDVYKRQSVRSVTPSWVRLSIPK